MIDTRQILAVTALAFILISGCTQTTAEDTEAPRLSLVSPFDSSLVYGRIEVQSDVSDNVSVAGVSYFLDDSLLNSSLLANPPYALILNTTSLTDSCFHSLKAVAEDKAGNESLPVIVSIFVRNGGRTPLTPIYFRTLSSLKHEISLDWEASADLRFYQYELFRSLRDTTAFPDTPITVIRSRSQNSYTDKGSGESSLGLVDLSTYYYRLRVLNSDSLSCETSMIHGTTRGPAKILWSNGGLTQVGKASVTLEWKELSSDDRSDLSTISILRISAEADTVDTALIVVPASQYINPWKDDSLNAETAYSYRIRQTDSLGFSAAWSTSLTATTAAFTFQPIITPTIAKDRIDFSFTPYTGSDFLSCDIYFGGKNDSLPGNLLPLYTTRSADSTSFSIGDLASATRYTLLLRFTDTYGNISDTRYSFSTKSLVTPEIFPEEIGRYSINMSISDFDNSENDFAATELYRLPSATDSIAGLTAVFTTQNVSDLSFQDSGLDPETNYYYIAVQRDTKGNASLSPTCQIMTASLDDVEFTQVSIDSGAIILYWEWSTEADPDFDHFELRRFHRRGTGATTEDGIVATPTEMQYRDSGLDPGLTYSYQISTVDSRGNHRSGRILNPVCSSVPSASLSFTGYTRHSVTLSWSSELPGSPDNFYRSYLYQNTTSVFPDLPDTSQTSVLKLVREFSDPAIQSYTLHNLTAGNILFYRLYMENHCGTFKAGNVVSALPLP